MWFVEDEEDDEEEEEEEEKVSSSPHSHCSSWTTFAACWAPHENRSWPSVVRVNAEPAPDSISKSVFLLLDLLLLLLLPWADSEFEFEAVWETDKIKSEKVRLKDSPRTLSKLNRWAKTLSPKGSTRPSVTRNVNSPYKAQTARTL